MGLGNVAHIGCFREHGEGLHSIVCIDTNVRLHTEVPLIVLLGLVLASSLCFSSTRVLR